MGCAMETLAQVLENKKCKNMIIDYSLLDKLTLQAKATPRLRINYDLRDSKEDESPADAERHRAGYSYSNPLSYRHIRGCGNPSRESRRSLL